MLKSIYQNSGFYIGKYEAGTNVPRHTKDDQLTTPVIQEYKYPYNFITCEQAQAEKLTIKGKTTSLMFGIQWDLVLKYIENKKGEILNEKEWGNYEDAMFSLTKGKYTINPKEISSWKEIDKTYEYKPENVNVLLTTRTSERNKILNIYDLAGNLYEWTLEKSAATYSTCVFRAGSYDSNSFERPVNWRGGYSIEVSTQDDTFRPVLY